MFCPVCRDEFRPGFTRCAKCDVSLVESLDDVPPPGSPPPSSSSAAAPLRERVRMIEYCGFLSLDEAREARDRLKPRRIRAEIVIRESGAALDPRHPPEEEFWLNVERDRYQDAVDVLGFDDPSAGKEGGTFSCGECGAEVSDEESFCPECGARFEDD